MRFSPSIAPENGPDIYIVLDDFDRLGRAWREMPEEQTERETLLRDLLSGQFSDPVRIIAFNTERQWSEDVSAEIAAELIEMSEGLIPPHLERFIEHHELRGRPLQLSLPIVL